MKSKFTKKDLEQFSERGINESVIKQQIENFRTGFPFLDIVKEATVKSGIIRIEDPEIEKFIEIFETESIGKKIVKFVPASGAASRMFKELFNFIETYTGSDEEYLKLIADKSIESVYYTIEHLDYFPFFDELKTFLLENNLEIEDMRKKNEFVPIFKALLSEKGLNYGNLPKALINFHKYQDGYRTPVQEHLIEAVNYCRSEDDKIFVHFTISPEHRKIFKKHVDDVKKQIEEKFNLKFNITLSEQLPSTDIIAVDENNNPFRDDDGNLLFRPGGHGALIENLNEIDADIIFIKNIDNIAPDSLKFKTFIYKKALAGMLMSLYDKICEYLEILDDPKDIDDKLLDKIYKFVEKDLFIMPGPKMARMSRKKTIKYLKRKLDRPLRICGMVRNEGEPGGGPFWAKNPDGTVSLQIVETAQIDLQDKDTEKIFQNSTHFNPVDLVCITRNYQGKKFDLHHFIDKSTGLISQKSKNGKILKAQELPGLWNGAMSDWITIFVEVPIETFSPVKFINDLLRENHQV
ncbi:MAG: DUF4301 family protein [Bacteroidia bacterium]|nr:DUF4301 family protein [Bacteroidia bacterium]